MRKNHFECDICLYQLNVQNRYYKDYNDLENHFRADHFLCEERECLAKKFVVFKSHIDLQGHMATDHPHIKTSRKIDVHFTVRRASQGDEDDFEDPRLFQQQASGVTRSMWRTSRRFQARTVLLLGRRCRCGRIRV